MSMLNKSTAYSLTEASKINQISWYQDKKLNETIINLIKEKHANTLYDICCGTGILYSEIISYYEEINAVDLSKYMIETNKMNNLFFNNRIKYYCDDAISFLSSNLFKLYGKDLLFKNCLQFLNLSKLQVILQSINFNHIFIVNTVNKSKHNFFEILKDNGFEFVSRTINYIMEDDLHDFCNYIGKIVETKTIEQETLLNDWLSYHGCDEKKIVKLNFFLDEIDKQELKKYNIIIRNNNFLLKRYEKIYCIGK